ncbi:MAG: histidine kinase dimerization/phospho-acceptor domain-containing protein, partial [Anaerolineae bacterium]
MREDEVGGDGTGDLRRRAEEALRGRAADPLADLQDLGELSPADVRRLVHELRVHQIELELQNEELRQAQWELEASRDRYFDLFDLAPVGYFTLSRKGLILEANLTGAATLGVERSRLVKKPLSRFIVRDDQAVFFPRYRAAFETGTRQTCELRMAKKDGTPFYAHLECVATEDGDGTVQARVAISDVSERVRAQEVLKAYSEQLEDMIAARTRELLDAQEQLVRQERLAVLGQLAGGVAHELRNPLSGIGNAAYFLNMVLDEPAPKTREALDILEKEVRNAENIINSLLDFARARPPARQWVGVNQVVREALSRVPVPGNVEVLSQLDETLPLIMADPVQLGQVFGNLIFNAIQAMTPPSAGDEGGRLVVKSEVAG